jgi:hypothetical protein
MDNIAHLHNP